MMKCFFHIEIILVIILLSVISCKKEEPVFYGIHDLGGEWEGYIKTEYFGGDNDGLFRIQFTRFTFWGNGYFPYLIIDPAPEYIFKNATMDVNLNGDITGIFTSEHESEYGTETTIMNWSGCKFLSKNEISINMIWTWTNPRPDEGYYEITGTITKKPGNEQ